MRVTAKKFIDLLEKQELLSPDIVDELRRQVVESKSRLTPQLLAKLLVDNGHLTKFQATKLIAEVSDTDDEIEKAEQTDDEELGLAETGSNSASQNAVAEVFLDDDDIVDVVDADEAEVVEVVDVVDTEPVDVVEVVEVVQAVSGQETSPLEPSGRRAAPTRAVRTPSAKSNPWDSFRILGAGVLLSLFLVALSVLVYYFFRGSAEDRIQKADSAYETRSYETAATMYKEFADSFPSHEKASYARVRSALALLRKDSENAPDPSLGLNTALAVLPGIASEEGLANQRSDLAGALVSLAEKFTDRVDDRTDTAERKQLMAEMDKLMGLINDPQFVGSTQRGQQAPSLARIDEDRKRILREINRDERLAVTLQEIDTKLSEKDTLGAYEIRSKLVNEYPLLEANEQLNERVLQATKIQQSLVSDSSSTPSMVDEQIAEVGKGYVLANRMGKSIPALSGQSVFVKVKGSVYGIDAETGKILWRKYVGRGFKSDPIRLGDSNADALLCEPEKGHLSRIAGASGDTMWSLGFGEPALSPSLDGDDAFVATYSGSVACIDTVVGQVKWSKQLPQPVEVRPGAAFKKPHVYLPAQHSNLYVLDRKDGNCKEVYYLGHREGSIAVPPVLLLGQLFVFENISSDSARIRILSTSDDGLQLSNAQTAIAVDGNIVAPPQIDGRRLIVQSDLGHMLVLDIEPSADSQKVSVLASVPKNLRQPQLSWVLAENNRIWIGDTRLTRFDLVVSNEKLNRAWSRNDGDIFTGPLHKFEDTLIHTRTLRGNRGIRVAAIDSLSGEPIWQTDVGVPITMLNRTGQGYDAVNSSGSYFKLERSPIKNEADADAGQGKPSMNFADPTWVTDSTAVLLNKSKANQFLVYTADGGMKVLSANIGSATPTSGTIGVEGKMAVGLDNGQFMLLDPTNGSLAAAPFQPTLQPGKKVKWLSAAYIPDMQNLFVANDLKQLARLSVGNSLRALAKVDLEAPLVGQLLANANKIAAIEASIANDSLLIFNATSLSLENKIALPGRYVSGPYAVGEGFLVHTDSHLVRISNAGETTWSCEFPNATLAAAPTEVGDNLLLVTAPGMIFSVNANTGEIIESLDAGQALSSSPIVLPKLLLVGGDEGAVLQLQMPSQAAGGN